MRRQASDQRIQDEIYEATADNLPQVLENIRVLGFGLGRNYKKIAISSRVANDDSSEEDGTSSAAPRYKSVFLEGNEPTPAQAYFHESGLQTKKPPHQVIFEGVKINSRDYEFQTIMSRVDPDDTSGRETRKVIATKSKALSAYNEKYMDQMHDIIKGMFANEIKKKDCDPANLIIGTWRKMSFGAGLGTSIRIAIKVRLGGAFTY